MTWRSWRHPWRQLAPQAATLLALVACGGVVMLLGTAAAEPDDPAPSEPAPRVELAEPATVHRLEEIEPNNGYTEAQEIQGNCDVLANLDPDKDVDYYRIRFARPTHLRAIVTAMDGIDVKLALFDRRRKLVMKLDGQKIGEGENLLHRVRRGEYVLSVAAKRPPRGAEAATGSYTLSIRPAELLKYEPSREEIKAAIHRGLGYLARQQGDDGALDPLKGKHGVTGLALAAFVGENLPEFTKTVEGMVDFFRQSHVPAGEGPAVSSKAAALGGSLVGRRCGNFIYEQAIAVLALAEYVHAHPDENLRAKIAEGVDLLVRSQNSARKPALLRGPMKQSDPAFGGWKYRPQDRGADISASGWCLIALKAAHAASFEVPEEVQRDAMVYCRRCWVEKAGKYGYISGGNANTTNTTNAVGVLTTLLCVGGKCDVVREGIRSIRRSLPCWQVEGDRGKYPFYYWYYASRAMYLAGGDYWKEWQGGICPMLLEHQNEDGSWDVNLQEEKVGPEYATALGVLILQLCSGNPPAYLKGMALESAASYTCPKLVEDIEKTVETAERDSRSKKELIRDIRKLIDRFYGE